MGAEVSWDGNTKTIGILKDNKNINLIIGNETATIDNLPTILDVPPQIIDGTTLVPIRFIAENFNCNVEWKGETKTVYITTNNAVSAENTTSFSIDNIPKYSGIPYVVVIVI